MIYAEQVEKVSNKHALKQATSDQVERAKKIAMLHLGSWEDGRRMTSQEKASLQKELGLLSEQMPKNPWQQALEKQGLSMPGQKWRTPTSENIN